MKLTETEWELMNALWSGHPATAREIAERIPGSERWAYTTVKTMLARLVAKDAVAERKRGNTSVYNPRLSRQAAQRSALGTVFDKVLNGALEPLAHFLVEERKLSAKERRRLIQLLDAADAGEGRDDDRNL
jgi:predicted transcriptional regulator